MFTFSTFSVELAKWSRATVHYCNKKLHKAQDVVNARQLEASDTLDKLSIIENKFEQQQIKVYSTHIN